MSQQFCLKWNNHMNNMMDVFKSLLSTESMVDVTLACDGLSLKAHKMVLSACSPFFQSLFLENPCKHPIVILKDMKYTELKAIIEFMYHGEVNVAQDQLSALMKTAETLRVKGLAEVTNEKNTQSSSSQDEPSHRSVPRTDTPPPSSKRRRGRTRKRSLSDSNRSDDDSNEPKIKQPMSPDIEELSGDVTMNVSSSQFSNLKTPVPVQTSTPALSSNTYHKTSSVISQDPQIEEPTSGDEGDFGMEPTKLLEQTLTTEELNRRNRTNVENQRRSRSSADHTIVPTSMSSDTSNQQPDSPLDIKPEVLDLDPPMSPVAGPSHSNDNAMMMFMDQSNSSHPGPSGYQDNTALVPQDSQPQGNRDIPSENGEDENKTEDRSKDEYDLIDLINNLQKKLAASGLTLDVPLPQIVVVGSQSVGKSSVLESFVGKEFLPRGTNTVTRRPTIVQMYPTAGDEFIKFGHTKEIFTDYKRVKEEIEKETNRHPGKTGFSSDPINIEIHSPRVLKLTVVDLPGLIKNVEDGQSDENIEAVRNMVLQFITPEESIILAVTPANQEIVNSDSLQIARTVDPKRVRTIGVLTKLDEPNDGVQIRQVLENKRIYLKKGYVGVVNRNQKEIDDGKDFDFILEREKDFFETNVHLKHLKNQMGIPYLVKMLQKILRLHIKQFLPKMRVDVSQKIADHQRDLKNFEKKLGDAIGGGQTRDKQFYIIKLIQKFMKDISVQLLGNSELASTEKISAGAMIQFKFATEVTKNLTLKMLPNETRSHIIILNQQGMKTSIGVPGTAVECLNRDLLSQYKGPMEDSVLCIKEVLVIAIEESAKMLERYPTLKNEVIFQINQCIEKETDNTKERLLSHIDANAYTINYNHPDFDSAACGPLAPPMGPSKIWESTCEADETVKVEVNGEVKSGIPSTETMLVELKKSEDSQKIVDYTSTLIMKLLEHVQKQMNDVALKYIIYFLVKKVLNFIEIDLLPILLGSSYFEALTEDCETDFKWKEETETTCKILEEALAAIRDF